MTYHLRPSEVTRLCEGTQYIKNGWTAERRAEVVVDGETVHEDSSQAEPFDLWAAVASWPATPPTQSRNRTHHGGIVIVKPDAPLSGVERGIWDLIEQSLLPSEREDAYRAYVSVLAAAWGCGRDAGYDDASREPVSLANGGYHRNPYDGSDPA